MLYCAVQMYESMNQGKGVPVLAWLLFARDSSADPQSLLQNHLNHVGDSGGLEQVEQMNNVVCSFAVVEGTTLLSKKINV